MGANKAAVVAGASSGIGRAAAVLLAGAGFDLVLVGRDKARLEETAAMAKAENPAPQALVLPTDLTNAAATKAIITKAVERFGRVDALANVAGAAPLLPLENVTPEIWQNCIDANVSYVVHLTASVWPVFRGQNGGVIVNVSSLASVDPFPGFGIYAPAKAAINMLTRCTASEGAKINVRAVAVAPGAVETPMLRSLFSESAIPTEKTLDPFEVAAVIRDCITGQRAFKPGETILLPSP